MKIRDGFVSNSSSSSFVVNKDCFSRKDIRRLEALLSSDGSSISKSYDYAECIKQWFMKENIENIEFATIIDNFDLYQYICDNFDVEEEDIVHTEGRYYEG